VKHFDPGPPWTGNSGCEVAGRSASASASFEARLDDCDVSAIVLICGARVRC